MKHLLSIFLLCCSSMLFSCNNSGLTKEEEDYWDSLCADLAKADFEPQYYIYQPSANNYNPEAKGTIARVCADVASWKISPEEAKIEDYKIAHNQSSGYLIRGAERNLDTIVNHTLIIFIVED